MNIEPTWVEGTAVRLIHRQQLAKFGGLTGIRDEGMLESALARPVNAWHYESFGILRLAAAYAFGIARNHPFVDGNKRTAFVVSVLFVELNGFEFCGSEPEAAVTFLALAAGELDENALAEWFETNSVQK